MSAFSKYRAGLAFVGGIFIGVVICLAALRVSDFALISQQDLDEQLHEIVALRDENRELLDDLFNYQGPNAVFDPDDLPYNPDADARAAVAAGREEAKVDGKFLMVTFGANWCVDCRTLHHHLNSEDVQAFAGDVFEFVNVDVGKFNRNRELAIELGIDLQRGIPVATFFAPDGQVIGTTNDGQLEPARYYTSKQILKFVRDIVEKSLISAPDSVQ